MAAQKHKCLKFMYVLLCFSGAVYMTVLQFIRLSKNEDVSSMLIEELNLTPETDYPPFTLCLVDEKGTMIFTQVYDYGIYSSEYQKYLMGDKEMTPDVLNIEFQNVAIKTEDFVLDFYTRDTAGNDYNTWTTSKFAQDNYHRNFTNSSSFPVSVSYQDYSQICFTRNTDYDPSLDRKYDEITLNLNKIRSTFPGDNCYFRIYVHGHSQFIKGVKRELASYKATHIEGDKSNFVAIKLSQITTLQKREDAIEPCNSTLLDEDSYFREMVMNTVNCTPAYWKSITQQQKLLPPCTTANQYKKIFNYLEGQEDPFSLYKQPCKSTAIVATSEVAPYSLHDYMKLRFEYLTKMFTKITNDKAVGMENFWGGVGGFVGIFLGYSLMQIPDFIPDAAVDKIRRTITNY